MPFGSQHETKRGKNWLLLAILLLLVGSIYTMTLVKYAH